VSTVVSDGLQKATKRVSKSRNVDWMAYQLAGEPWERVSKIMVGVLDEMKGHGVGKPLASLQELAMKEALKNDAGKDKDSRAIHTVALWLTDTRILAEQYAEAKGDRLRKIMERRGLLKKREG
jgi:hypothetical protein